jgi:hypothetical protein
MKSFNEEDIFSRETQEFFADAIITAKLRVSFAESMLSAAQRELDDARESLNRLETRRKRLGVPIADIGSNYPNRNSTELLPDDISLLSEDHAQSVGSRSTMYLGSVGGTFTATTDHEKSSSGFSFKNSLRNLRHRSSSGSANHPNSGGGGSSSKNNYNENRSVSSAPALVSSPVASPLSSSTDEVIEDDDAPTKRSVTPETNKESFEEDNNSNDGNSNNTKTVSKKQLFAMSPARTASTVPGEEDTEEENGDVNSRASAAATAALEKQDEDESVEYAVFKQILKDHYSPPGTDRKRINDDSKDDTEEAPSPQIDSKFEPLQIDMVTMDTIIEEPIDPEDGVAVIEVSESGIPQINGSYLKFDSRDGVPTYSKIEKFEGYETMFTIGRWAAPNGTRKWYFTAIVPGQSRSMKSVFYVAYSSSNVPPKDGWMVVNTDSDLFLTPEYLEKGVPALPKLEWEMEGDGVDSVANTYMSRRSSVSQSHYYEVGTQVLNVLTRDT